jgi:hypothetical protein
MLQRHKSTQLSIQITKAERQVLHRRRVVRERTFIVGQSLRRKLASPAMLLGAGSIGFAAGQFTGHPASRPDNARHARAAGSNLFEKALKLIALVRVLSKAFPPTYMDPSAQSELPAQTPTPRYRSAAA